ncbi:MAG: hypothetical protein JWO38_4924 [Gemmataceae bacterium]|nr:hypothetical protein [Gemmataceae bacterium]
MRHFAVVQTVYVGRDAAVVEPTAGREPGVIGKVSGPKAEPHQEPAVGAEHDRRRHIPMRS